MTLYKKKTSLGKRISHIFEYIFTVIFGFLINLVPYKYLDNVSSVLSRFLIVVLPQTRKRVLDNITFYYKDKSPEELESFVKINLKNTLRVTLEVFQSWKFRKKSFLEKYISVADQKSMDYIVKRGKGLIAIAGHFGSWEIPIMFYSHHNQNIAFSAKHLSNPYVDRKLDRRRKRYGGRIIYLDESMKLIRELKKGGIIGLVSDQDAGSDGIFVDFLGRKAATFPGPALFCHLTNCDIVLTTCVFKGKGKYEIEVKPIYNAKENKKYPDRDEALQHITQVWSRALEKEVKKNPEQYFWIHRRWKTQPAVAASTSDK